MTFSRYRYRDAFSKTNENHHWFNQLVPDRFTITITIVYDHNMLVVLFAFQKPFAHSSWSNHVQIFFNLNQVFVLNMSLVIRFCHRSLMINECH